MRGSEANEIVVREAFEAWNRDDYEQLAEIYHPDVVAVAPADFPEAGLHRGWEALRRRYEELKAEWEWERIEVGELASAGDRVAARVRWIGRGRTSGAPISLEVTNLVTIERRRITRLEYFWSFEEAVAALGREATTHEPAAPAE